MISYTIISILIIIILMLLVILYHYQEQIWTIPEPKLTKKTENKETVIRYKHKPTTAQLKEFVVNNKGPFENCFIYIEKEWSSRDNWYLLCSGKYYAPTGLLYTRDICTIEGIPKTDIQIKTVARQ